MKAYELINWLNIRHPQKFAEEWDNVGLLVGDDQKEISHVFLALDLTEPVLDEAVAAGADMILTHHPMIFSGIKKINNHSFTGRKIISLVRHGISYYAMQINNHTFTGRKILRLIREDIPYFAMHTNYDVIGMADLSADYLKLQDTKVLTVTDESGEQPEGFGRVGKLPRAMTLGEFVKECNCLPDVRVYGDLDQRIETVAICTGSGKSMIRDVMAAGADVYVTGDIDYHTAIDTMADGLAIVDAGHYGTEYIFAEAMERELNEAFPDLKTTCASVKNPYMQNFSVENLIFHTQDLCLCTLDTNLIYKKNVCRNEERYE